MAAAAHAINGYPSKLVELRSKNRKRASAPPPLFISTSPSHVNPRHLADLFASSNLSCHRFPNVDPLGRVEPVDIHKLRVALSHSSVVVSVFCRPEDVTTAKSSPESLKLGDLFRRVMPVTHSNGQLVGFGRAVSDSGLTASIYDVMEWMQIHSAEFGQLVRCKAQTMLFGTNNFQPLNSTQNWNFGGQNSYHLKRCGDIV